MANKRVLKKEIHRVCGALAGECVMARLLVPDADREALNELVYQLAELQESALKLVKVDFPGNTRSYPSRKEYAQARREYFKASATRLRDHFNKRVQEIIKGMNDAIPAQTRKDRVKNVLELGFANQ